MVQGRQAPEALTTGARRRRVVAVDSRNKRRFALADIQPQQNV